MNLTLPSVSNLLSSAPNNDHFRPSSVNDGEFCPPPPPHPLSQHTPIHTHSNYNKCVHLSLLIPSISMCADYSLPS